MKKESRPSRERQVLVLAGILLFGLLYYFLLVSPALKRIDATVKEKEKVQEAIGKLRKDESLFSSYDARKREILEQKAHLLLSRIPPEQSIQDLCLELSRLGAQVGIGKIEFEFNQGKQEATTPLKSKKTQESQPAPQIDSFTLNLDLSCFYVSLFHFLQELPSIQRLVTPVELTIEPQDIQVKVALTVKSFSGKAKTSSPNREKPL